MLFCRLPLMDIRAVRSATSSTAPAGAMGVSAQLADARSRLRTATPVGAWEDVLEEVQRVREERGITLLAALQLVYEKLTTGWRPVRRR